MYQNLTLGVCFSLALVSLLVVIARTKTFLFIKEIDPDAAANLRFLGFLILYVVFIPIHLTTILNMSLCLLKKQVSRYYQCPNTYFNIKNSVGLVNLGAV